MKLTVLTLFPEMFQALNCSMTGRAFEKNILDFTAINIRDFSKDKHFKCDDIPYGGGAGMVMTAQPIIAAFKSIDSSRKARRIYMSPKGQLLNIDLAKRLSEESELILLCGHYEGIDQRAIDLCIDEEISIGDYVLTGGELPAMVLIDCISRFIPGVLGSDLSAEDESFSFGLLEYPHYTRPQIIEGISVPEVLLSGHHANIEKWRRQQSEIITQQKRPDLFNKSVKKSE